MAPKWRHHLDLEPSTVASNRRLQRRRPGNSTMTSRWPLQLVVIALATVIILMFRMLVSDDAARPSSSPITIDSDPLPSHGTPPREDAPIALDGQATPSESVEAGPNENHAVKDLLELPATAWTKVTWLQGRHAMPAFLEVFLTNLPAARAGDTDAMVNLAFAIENCHMAAGFPTRADLDAFATSRPFAAPQDVEAMAELIPDCRKIAAEVPEGLRIQQWSADWLQRAATGGDALARYLLVNQWERSDTTYVEAAEALAEAVATGSPWALREAAEFVLNYPPPSRDDPYQVEASAWLVLACRGDPACDARVLKRQIRWAQLPAYADQIMLRAAQIRGKLDAGESFDFNSGWRRP